MLTPRLSDSDVVRHCEPEIPYDSDAREVLTNPLGAPISRCIVYKYDLEVLSELLNRAYTILQHLPPIEVYDYYRHLGQVGMQQTQVSPKMCLATETWRHSRPLTLAT